MNFALTYQQEQQKNDRFMPDEFDGMLDCSSLAICCAFNRRGSLLAVGCNDGRVVIWDFLTRQIAKNIAGHANHPVCSLSWSRDGHRLVSASLDNSIAIWKVKDGECITRWKFPSPILKAQFNPRNDRFILVCPLKHQSILIEINYETVEIDYKNIPTEDGDLNIIASFDRRGQYIFTGNARGKFTTFKCPSTVKDLAEEFQIVSSFRIQTTGSTPPAIREIETAARNKANFLVNSSDKTIRLYHLEDVLKAGINGTCDDRGKFRDDVCKNMWRRCCLSGDIDATHVCGGSAREHTLTIWDREGGGNIIKKMLHGTKGELLLDVQWHPLRPMIASISSGLISIWAKPQIENWSAFAPDFKELDDNADYDERESEFDIEDEDKIPDTNKRSEDDNEDEVDVTEVQPDADLLSSDEDGEDVNALDFIPITLEDYELMDVTQTDLSYPPQPKEDPIKGPRSTIEIKLENPPVDEIHPLLYGSSKRKSVNDKSNFRKVPRQS